MLTIATISHTKLNGICAVSVTSCFKGKCKEYNR
jgi:hypothetical protein